MSSAMHSPHYKWNFGYWVVTHRKDVIIHMYFLGQPEKWDFHKLRLKGKICFQLVMVCIQHEKYASQSIPRGFKELLIKKETKRWLIRCWNHYKSDLWGISYFLWNLLSEKINCSGNKKDTRKLMRQAQQQSYRSRDNWISEPSPVRSGRDHGQV